MSVRKFYGVSSNIVSAYDFEQALEFDGVDDFCNMTALSSSSITLSMWVYRNSVSGFIDSILGQAGNPNVYLVHNTNEVRIKVSDGVMSIFNTTGMLPLVWNHYFITWDSVSKVLKLYINGDEKTPDTSIQNVGFDVFNVVGSRGQAPFFGGKLDDFVSWYGIVGTQQNAIDLYNGGAGVNPTTVIPNPNRWYKFNGDDTDSGSDAANLTITGATFTPH